MELRNVEGQFIWPTDKERAVRNLLRIVKFKGMVVSNSLHKRLLMNSAKTKTCTDVVANRDFMMIWHV